MVRGDLMPPQGTSAVNIAPPAISPDGRNIAFVASGQSGRTIYIRQFDSSTTVPVSGSSGARAVFWSADGASLGFTTDEGLFRVDAGGGTPRALYRGTLGFWNGTWNARGDVLFVPQGSNVAAIHRVSSEGGAVTAVTQVDSERGRNSAPFSAVSSRRDTLPVPGDSAPDLTLMSVSVKQGTIPVFGTPAPLFKTVIPPRSLTLRNAYAVTRDSQRFLMEVPMGPDTAMPFTIVMNWWAAFP
jgi:hypothetical protein